MPKRIAVGAPILAATLAASLLTLESSPAQEQPSRSASDAHGRCGQPWLPWPAVRLNSTKRPPPPPPHRPIQPGQSSEKSSDRPNVLVLMVDDMRDDELSGPWMNHTRELLEDQGARFTNSFSPLPLCGPARASFLSGKYAHNTGVRDNVAPSSFDAFNDRNTLPVWLQRSGYTTVQLGKYINGYGDSQYVPPGWDRWYASTGDSTYRYYGTKLSNNGSGQINLAGRYQTTAYGDIGSKLLAQLSADRKPFFLNVSFTAPHTGSPVESDDPDDLGTAARRPDMRGRYNDVISTPRGEPGEFCNDDKPSVISDRQPLSPLEQAAVVTASRQRAEALATVDDSIAQLIGTLRRSGELDNTYVVFTSDNGFFQGEFRFASHKRLTYEPALRTPTLVRGPGIKPGIVRRSPFTTIDFAPTIADMTGSKVRANVDGISLLPSATGKDRGWTRPILTDVGPREGDEWYGLGVRAKGLDYQQFDDENAPEELYDLRRDPHENYNLAGEPGYQDERHKLASVLEDLRGCAGAGCRH